MKRKKKGEVEWLEFELFSEIPELVHGVFLRHGGISEGPFASLNVGGGTGDEPEKIVANRELIRQVMQLPALISGKQVHGVDIVTVPGQDRLLENSCDGLMTQKENLGLMIKHADCQAAIFYDPVNKVIANVHAGWRGSVQNIYAKTIETMQRQFGSRAQDLLVGISPSLGPLYAEFKNYRSELPECFWDYQVKPTYFDLWAISRMQLEEKGVLPYHIELASICTHSDSNNFFSYRRDKITGRHATVASLIYPNNLKNWFLGRAKTPADQRSQTG